MKCSKDCQTVVCEMLEALELAQALCKDIITRTDKAVNLGRKHLGRCHYADDGTLLSGDGSRSIFDDVDA